MGDIVCLPTRGFPMDTAQTLVGLLKDVFQSPCHLEQPAHDILADAFDSSRGQYYSTALLKQLGVWLDGGYDRVLGLTDVDLFIPIFTFVFGEAQVDGQTAIVSTYRLRNEFYGLPADPDLCSRRLSKEAVHELGHTFGLRHCGSTGCVMGKSTYVEEIDLKGHRFCYACSGYIQK